LIPRLFNWVAGRPNFKSARLTELTRFSLTTDFYKDYPPPFVLYEHVVAPHPPFNIDRNGNATTRWKAFSDMEDGGHATLGGPRRQQRYIEGYLEKLRYVNAEVVKQLQAMVEDVPAPKVIMLHGDHGGGAYYLPDDPELSCLNERYSPFLAVYTDDPQIRAAFAHIATERVNLVNLYRLIFDARFGTDLGLAADRSWFNSWDSPRELIELSDEQISASCNVAAGS
jgi:hypothetical protein